MCGRRSIPPEVYRMFSDPLIKEFLEIAICVTFFISVKAMKKRAVCMPESTRNYCKSIPVPKSQYPQSITLYYRVLLCATDCNAEYCFARQSTTVNYRVLLCTAEYYCVVQSITLHYRVPLCTTE